MRWPTFILLGVLSVVLGIANNLVNPNRVSWFGSPPVLPKPEGWPTVSVAEGVAGAWRVTLDGLSAHWYWVLLALLVLAGGRFFFRRSGASRRRWSMSWWRVLFAFMFLAAAWPKFTDPQGFAMMVAQYQMLPAFSVNLFSVLLPAVEVMTGLALLFSPFEKESTAWLGIMMVMFIIALAQALYRQLGIACGCFDIQGATDPGQSWFAFLRDIVLMWPIAWMWLRAERRPLWKF